eukprot:TRINITY_DN845_c2_g1_i1.p1 TRINITY_DN845_c2_g1~~TRINITY_DN845_c2_g1_i1.p1  ORF type:complete len:265 (-),score=129.29 TRINITY_DN845_c2_g1_i1:157-951(-)
MAALEIKSKSYDNGSYYGEYNLSGQRHGVGSYFFNSGNRYTGEWDNGKKHGVGSMVWKSGGKFTGQWYYDKKHGPGIEWFQNGDRYEGEFKDGIKEGKGSYYWVNGDKYYGEWKNDFICGKGEEWSASGSKYEGQYKDGKKHGEGILIDYTGKKYKVTYDTGKQQTKELFVEDNKEELASLSSDKYDTEVSKWLTENNLSLYIDNFFDQGFEDLEDVGTLSEEEIQEELKITKLGHRRKIMKKINSMGGGSVVTDGPKLPERDY